MTVGQIRQLIDDVCDDAFVELDSEYEIYLSDIYLKRNVINDEFVDTLVVEVGPEDDD